jgi:hypothetical protein
MSIFLRDPNEVRLPPEEVRLKKVHVTPLPNGRRVRIALELTPFQQPPSVEVTIATSSGKQVSQATILETMLPKLELTMHLREFDPGGIYDVETRVYYQLLPEASKEPMDIDLPEPKVVDQKVMTFTFPKSTA